MEGVHLRCHFSIGFSSYCCSHTESAARCYEAITLTVKQKLELPDKTLSDESDYFRAGR